MAYQNLEDFKIDLLGFGLASMAHRSEGLAVDRHGKCRGDPPQLHKLNVTLIGVSRFIGIFQLFPIPIAQNFVVCLIRFVTSSEWKLPDSRWSSVELIALHSRKRLLAIALRTNASIKRSQMSNTDNLSLAHAGWNCKHHV